MTPVPTYRTVDEAYLAELGRTYRQGDATCVAGRRERLGVAFDITHPLERLVLSPARRANVVFHFAEVLWYLAGRDDLDFIGYYAPSMARWSPDGRVMTGSAYGRRFFAFRGEPLDQWSVAVDLLRRDQSSTRAVVQVFDPAELLTIPGNRDIACTVALQLMVRRSRLHMLATMRANDAFRGAASDVFSFTFLQEMAARRLGVEMGTYHHRVGSFHTIDVDNRWIEEVLAEKEPVRLTDDLRFPPMPAGDQRNAVDEVLSYEECLRLDTLRLGRRDIESLSLDPYWQQVVALFEVQRQVRHRTQQDATVAAMLAPVLARAVRLRWPALGRG